ncbi:MAG: DUF1697 domain-containing protein [Actinobacteria bacterium]|nr:DUF1697 domain-containing protein [Actinomycetota bacterium]MBV8598258.1 DUF1697 domain-containing protein [Actinomycetota bacterium]
MGVHVVLLRGVNVGPHNRVSMPALRQVLEAAGFVDVRTYLQSGNVVLASRKGSASVAREVRAALAGLGLDVAVVVRSAAEIARVVQRDPLGNVATDPKRYQVTFLESPSPRDFQARLEAAAVEGERVVVDRLEVYAWHPHGIARSRLWTSLLGKNLGVVATSRNWTTVEALHQLASD